MLKTFSIMLVGVAMMFAARALWNSDDVVVFMVRSGHRRADLSPDEAGSDPYWPQYRKVARILLGGLFGMGSIIVVVGILRLLSPPHMAT